jgi:hypothetical protein
LGVKESSAVAVIIGMGLLVMAMGPVMSVWLLTDIQAPDTYARPEMITKAGAPTVQNLCDLFCSIFTRRTPPDCRERSPDSHLTER